MIYFDNAASAPTRQETIEAMLPILEENYGNPSGSHAMARKALRAIDDARDILAEILGCRAQEIIYTSGGTEADNLAIFGTHNALGGTIICSATEHHAVLEPTETIGGQIAKVNPDGSLDLNHLADLLNVETTLVSIGLVNGETGIIQDLEPISDLIKELAPNALLHTDAVQGFPWLDIPTATKTADLISIAAHKFGGPKGIGVLVAKEKTKLAPMQLGGGQEQGIRSGTQDVAGIVGMAAAAQQTAQTRQATIERITPLRNELADGLTTIEGSYETGVSKNSNGDTDRSRKVAGSCHICFEQIESEALLFLLEQENILASAASSCSSGAQDPSHVLAAMGYNRELAGGSLRLSFGYKTSNDDVKTALDIIPRSIMKLRETGS